ncbi:MAG: hypothetical protein J6P57_01365, partial [Lachnospiraceae bacterium]|nr:hypothetical protein [Lachnospiraceae bacterium]
MDTIRIRANETVIIAFIDFLIPRPLLPKQNKPEKKKSFFFFWLLLCFILFLLASKEVALLNRFTLAGWLAG